MIIVMKYSREYILRRAFDVFMDKGYDSTSISVLQQELNMSRGAMYRYFKNKEELFISVIDEYVFKLFERLVTEVDPTITTAELIDLIHKRQRRVFSVFSRAGVTNIVFMNYTALIIQAVKHYPDFLMLFKGIHKHLLSSWKLALQNSIDAKEVRDDIDIEIMAILFNNSSVKESSERENESTDQKFKINILCDMNRRKEVMDYLYSLIKI